MNADEKRAIVMETIGDTLGGLREQTRRARTWLAYCEAAQAYYEEWARTGEVPAREFPKPQGDL